MAATSLSLLLLAQRYRGNIVRQVNRKAVTLGLMKIKEDGGKNVAWGFKLSGHPSRAILEGADTTVFGQDTQVPAVLDWGLYEFPMAITNLAAAAAASSGGDPDSNNNPWNDQIQDGISSMASTINVDLFQGDGTGSSNERTLVGLGEIFGSTTNTYAGRDRSDSVNALLRPGLVTGTYSSPAPFTIKDFRDDLAAIYTASGVRPNFAAAKPALFNQIGSRFDNIRRIEQDATVMTGRGAIKLDGSARMLEVDGCVVYEDKDAGYATDTATSGSLTYWNSDHVTLNVLPPDSTINQYVKRMEGMRLNDGQDEFALNILFEVLAKTGASLKGRGELTLQLKCDKPNTGGVRSGILIA